ncbi:hypothetical protein DEJ27_03465 [Curtobacterium sp. MCPF17_018]|nr:hypothetical protein DEJ27_03465 [Curtobacterium sp. MCPF17_018]
MLPEGRAPRRARAAPPGRWVAGTRRPRVPRRRCVPLLLRRRRGGELLGSPRRLVGGPAVRVVSATARGPSGGGPRTRASGSRRRRSTPSPSPSGWPS